MATASSKASKIANVSRIAEASSSSPRKLFSFRDNPIAKAEFRHQRHVLNTSRSGIIWILLASVMLIPAMLYGMVLYGAVLFNFSLPDVDQFTTFGQILGWLVAMLVTMNIALYGVVILITLGLSAQSITREKTGGTWDTLVLTNIDARTIVRGKWWASVRALWGDHLRILLLRLGFLGQILIFLRDNSANLTVELSINLMLILPLTALIILITVIDAGFTAALGIAMPLSAAGNGLVMAGAIAVRIGAFIALGMMAWDVGGRILSGGTWFLVGLLWVAGFIVATWLALRCAEWLAIRGQVSAPDQHNG